MTILATTDRATQSQQFLENVWLAIIEAAKATFETDTFYVYMEVWDRDKVTGAFRLALMGRKNLKETTRLIIGNWIDNPTDKAARDEEDHFLGKLAVVNS